MAACFPAFVGASSRVSRETRSSEREWISNWATLIAATLVIFVAALLIRRPVVSPVVMVSALLPLGAALPFFRAIADFLSIPSMTAERLALLPQTMLSNLGKVFTTTVAIGVGVSVAIYVVRALRREALE